MMNAPFVFEARQLKSLIKAFNKSHFTDFDFYIPYGDWEMQLEVEKFFKERALKTVFIFGAEILIPIKNRERLITVTHCYVYE